MLNIYNRKQWKAKRNKGTLVRMVRLRKIVIHHAAGYKDGGGALSFDRIREIQALHQIDRKWNDIGYHFLVDSTGCIFQGRDFYDGEDDINNVPQFIHGAHVKSQNSDKIGVCLFGCFEPSAGLNCTDTLTQGSFDALVELCVFICSRYGLNEKDILMHKDLRPSLCPGSNIESEMTKLKDKVGAQLLPR